MAVEARNLNVFPQFVANRELMNPIEANGGIYNTQMEYCAVPLSGITTAAETTLIPVYSSVNINNNNSFVADSSFLSHIMKPTIRSMDSSISYNGKNNNDFFLLPNNSRKRPREDSVVNPFISVQKEKSFDDPLSFLGHDVSLHIQQQQLDLDRLISHHTERVKTEIKEKRKRQGRRIMEAIEQSVMKRLGAKEEEIEKIGKLNYVLEERVKSLCLENQIWRDLAQTNEATANALRNNLEQVLAAAECVRDGARTENTTAEVADDAQSFCGSSRGDDDEEEEVERTFAGDKKKGVRGCTLGTSRMCRNCGKEESCVLLLPCRHLCLCNVCGSTLHTCPICKSVKNASVHVNLSS